MNNSTKHAMYFLIVMAGVSPWSSHALEIIIQGQSLVPDSPTATCINIAGDYQGVKIKDSEKGRKARVCQQSLRSNLVILGDANFVALEDGAQIEVRFQHDFGPGLNGQVIGRVRADGVFAGATGTQAPAGSRIEMQGFLNQGASVDLVQEALAHTVDNALDLEGAVFELATEKQYLVAGRRTLKGVLTLSFEKAGDQMVVTDGIRVALDPLYTKDRRRID